MPENSIAVKRELRTLHQLLQGQALNEMDAITCHTLTSKIAPLMGARVLSDKYAIQFDKLIASLQRCLLEKASCFEDGRAELLAEVNKLAVNIQVVRQHDALREERTTPQLPPIPSPTTRWRLIAPPIPGPSSTTGEGEKNSPHPRPSPHKGGGREE